MNSCTVSLRPLVLSSRTWPWGSGRWLGSWAILSVNRPMTTATTATVRNAKRQPSAPKIMNPAIFVANAVPSMAPIAPARGAESG